MVRRKLLTACAILSIFVACGGSKAPPPKTAEVAKSVSPVDNKARCADIAAKRASCGAAATSQEDCEKIVSCSGGLMRPEALSGVLDCMSQGCTPVSTCSSSQTSEALNLAPTPVATSFIDDCKAGKFKCLNASACAKPGWVRFSDSLWPSMRECAEKTDCTESTMCLTGVLMKVGIEAQSCAIGSKEEATASSDRGGDKDADAATSDRVGASKWGVGKPAPALALTGLDGKRIAPASFAGKVVVVDFWASWCEPCKRSMPGLQTLNAKYKKRGLAIVGISVDDEDRDAKAFARAHPVKYPLAWEKDHSTAYAWQPRTMPARALVDRKGIVRYVQEGFHDGDVELLAKQIESLL